MKPTMPEIPDLHLSALSSPRIVRPSGYIYFQLHPGSLDLPLAQVYSSKTTRR